MIPDRTRAELAERTLALILELEERMLRSRAEQRRLLTEIRRLRNMARRMEESRVRTLLRRQTTDRRLWATLRKTFRRRFPSTPIHPTPEDLRTPPTPRPRARRGAGA